MKNQNQSQPRLSLNQESLRWLTSEEEENGFFKPSLLETHCAACTRVMAD